MARFLGEDQVRRVKEAVDLVEVMSDYAPPQRSGRMFKVCCPFHQERSPSCYLYPEGTYHCFGCGAHGDVITLVREKEALDFVDAVEFLARRAGIELVYEERGSGSPSLAKGTRDRLLMVMTFAVEFFQRQLWEGEEGAAARAYLLERGINEDLAREFALGWAPGRNALCSAARSAGYRAEDLLEVNVAMDREGRIGDRFYERITFPICDRFGQPIAFSARILPEADRAAKAAGRSLGKYINTNDTPLYHKSSVVWNLHRARSEARHEQRLVVMEGPTDVMAAAAVGIRSCVAVLGTAMTAEHARQLGTVLGGKGRLVLLFDGDSAGQANSIKAVGTCIGAGVACRVAVLDGGKDPAELVANGGRPALDAVLSQDRSDVDHLLRCVAPAPHLMEPHQRVEAMDRCLAVVRPLPDQELRRAYLEEIGNWFKMELSRLERRLAGAAPRETSPAAAPATGDGPPDRDLDMILHIMVRHRELRSLAGDGWGLEPAFFSPPWRQLVDDLLSHPDRDESALVISEIVREDPVVAKAVHRYIRETHGRGGQDLSQPSATLRDLVHKLQRSRLDEEIGRIQGTLAACQREGDMIAAGSLMKELLILQKRRREGTALGSQG